MPGITYARIPEHVEQTGVIQPGHMQEQAGAAQSALNQVTRRVGSHSEWYAVRELCD